MDDKYINALPADIFNIILSYSYKPQNKQLLYEILDGFVRMEICFMNNKKDFKKIYGYTEEDVVNYHFENWWCWSVKIEKKLK